MTTVARLAAAWTAEATRWGASPAVAAESGADILARHGEAHRRYHTAAHVADVLGWVATLAEEYALGPDQRTEATLSAWLHDVIYDPRAGAGQNEAASASYAAALLTRLGAPASLVASVSRLIRLTAAHDAPAGDPAAAVLIDADLAVLGSGPRRYARYVAGVRAEYAWVDDDGWRAGRSAVLRSFLDRDRLYATDAAAIRLDGPARRNLRRELAALGDG